MKSFVIPKAGRLVFRQLAAGCSLFLGCLDLPGCDIEEGAGYFLYISGDRLALVPGAINKLPDALKGMGLSSYVKAAIWRESVEHGLVMARFICAGSRWMAFGVSQRQLLGGQDVHTWFDICDGRATSIAAPFDAVGMACTQVVQQHAVWPSGDGSFTTLPVVERAWRDIYTKKSHLLADVGDGILSIESATTLLKADPQAAHLGLWSGLSRDRDYCAYLSCLRKLGGLDRPEMMTADELTRYEKLSSEAIRMSLEV
ncbi:hypothetical protein [Herbaspirillum huttiense]|uniref:hypothetical protein n=1 Tax=Herbaspirillum huttiense TaxID=863372 RepID=UPI0039AF11E6